MVEAALDVDVSAELLHELVNDVKPKPGSRRFAGSVVFGAVELLKDMLEIGFAYPDTGIFDGKLYTFGSSMYAERHRTFLSVFDGVRDEVLE